MFTLIVNYQFLVFLLLVVLLMSQADEDGTKHGEHVGLHKGHQQLQAVHKEQHDDAERVESQAETDTH